MTATEINNTLIDSYLKLLSGLTERNKKLLIEKLKASKKKKVSNNSFLSAFGADRKIHFTKLSLYCKILMILCTSSMIFI